MGLQPVILSGGAGSRLWPLSRQHFPKQLLSLVDENQTLIQATAARLKGLQGVKPTLVVCNDQHRFLVAEQLRAAGRPCAKIILESQGKNTAPALTLAALSALEGETNDPVLLVMPADHVIDDVRAFQQAVALGESLAALGHIITFGIVPTGPVTGYGYIKRQSQLPEADGGAYTIERFIEKPDLPDAKAFVQDGAYYWNSGIFMMRPSVWLSALDKYAPKIAEVCRQAYAKGSDDADFYRVNAAIFADCPSDSIDYAVMEPLTGGTQAAGAVVIPLQAGWSDIGAWAALKEVLPKDDDGNVFRGDVIANNTRNTLVVADHRMVATVGVADVTVVETADAVLVVKNDQAEKVKEIVAQLKRDQRQEHLIHRQVFRPWGSYEGVDVGDRFQVKRLTVNPGASLSLQMHHHRAEHWIVVRGTAIVNCGDREYLISENQSTYIPIGEKHRLANPGKVPLEIIEVQSGSYLGEDDIVRFEDNYGRIDDLKAE